MPRFLKLFLMWLASEAVAHKRRLRGWVRWCLGLILLRHVWRALAKAEPGAQAVQHRSPGGRDIPEPYDEILRKAVRLASHAPFNIVELSSLHLHLDLVDQLYVAGIVKQTADAYSSAQLEEVERGREEARMVRSAASLISAPGDDESRCFLAGALLETPAGQFVRASTLEAGMEVRASHGEALRVKSARVHEETEHTLVSLLTETAGLTVTASHRVMVRKGREAQTLAAGALRVGDHVLVADGRAEQLLQTKVSSESTSVVEVAFQPDLPVAAYHPPSHAILSKGHGWPKTRRGRQHREDRRDDISVADTDESWLYQRAAPA